MLKLLRQLALAAVLVGTLFMAAPVPAEATSTAVSAELVQPIQYYRGYGYRRGYYRRPYYRGYYRRPYYRRHFYSRRFYRPY